MRFGLIRNSRGRLMVGALQRENKRTVVFRLAQTTQRPFYGVDVRLGPEIVARRRDVFTIYGEGVVPIVKRRRPF